MQALAASRGRCPSTIPKSTCLTRNLRSRAIIKAATSPNPQNGSSRSTSRLASAAVSGAGSKTQPLRSSALDSSPTSVAQEAIILPVETLESGISAATGPVVSSVVPFRSPSRQGAAPVNLVTPRPGSPLQQKQKQQQAAGAMATVQTAQSTDAGVAAGAPHPVLGCSKPLASLQQVRMQVHGPAKMGISFWPAFSFTPPARHPQPGTCSLLPPTAAAAAAAAGSGEAVTPGAGHLVSVKFTQDPPDEFRVGANFLGGIPFPLIVIRTSKLEGTVDCDTGAVVLDFEAQFLCGWGQEPSTSLTVNTQLTTEPAQALNVRMEGKRLQGGTCELIAAATVPKTGYWLADFILSLPTAAYARLPTSLTFLSEPAPVGAASSSQEEEDVMQPAAH